MTHGAQHPVHHGAKTICVLDWDTEELDDHHNWEREGQIGEAVGLVTRDVQQPHRDLIDVEL